MLASWPERRADKHEWKSQQPRNDREEFKQQSEAEGRRSRLRRLLVSSSWSTKKSPVTWEAPNIIIIIWISQETPDPQNASFVAIHFRAKLWFFENLLCIPMFSTGCHKNRCFCADTRPFWNSQRNIRWFSGVTHVSNQELQIAECAWHTRLTPLKKSHLQLALCSLARIIVIIIFF